MRTMLKSKIHRARVTGLSLDYKGSITIDKSLMAKADILPYEQVQVLNLNNGARFTTYAIEGEADSGEVCINGAAARLAKKGDIILILAFCQVEEDEAATFLPRLVYMGSHNRIIESRHVIDTLSF
ncbi:aspartate 1-decarboxylase [Chloroflexota bacterium]